MATAAVLSPTLRPDQRQSVADLEAIDAVFGAVDHVSSLEIKNSKLVVSPYTEEAHLLDLQTLDIPNQLFAKALISLKCLRSDYAVAPYVEIFNVRNPPTHDEKMSLRKKNPLTFLSVV